MSHRLPHPDTTFVGLDVHKSSITSAVLVPSADVAVVDRFYPDEASIRRFLSGLGDPGLGRSATRPARPAITWPDCFGGSAHRAR
ncbi:MAG TPA: hypothetical protein VKY90_04030 [Candidatus Dormibacteraeota bacterium]|nr:hypothetical protein [Candidatus Dormibacteraeota bacterium]